MYWTTDYDHILVSSASIEKCRGDVSKTDDITVGPCFGRPTDESCKARFVGKDYCKPQ